MDLPMIASWLGYRASSLPSRRKSAIEPAAALVIALKCCSSCCASITPFTTPKNLPSGPVNLRTTGKTQVPVTGLRIGLHTKEIRGGSDLNNSEGSSSGIFTLGIGQEREKLISLPLASVSTMASIYGNALI